MLALIIGVCAVIVVVRGADDDGRTDGVARPTATPTPAPSPRSCSEVAQHGVTFVLDRAHLCGTFANGDAWVAPAAPGPVVIQTIEPAAAQGRHGLMVNPTSDSDQAYDDRVGGYTPELLPALPYRASGVQSLVKAVSAPGNCGNGKGHPTCVQSATVLTVLTEPPPDLGRSVFRPPYFGDDKPLISTKAIQADALPSLPIIEGGPSLDDVRDRYARVQLDHKSNWQGRYLHPAESFRSFDGEEVSNYGSDLARDNVDAALTLMLEGSLEEKMPALVNYLQAGIDWYGTGAGGAALNADGGHNVGRKVVVTFAGVVLDNAAIKAVASRTEDEAYSENGQVYASAQDGRALFGKPCSDGEYEEVLNDGRGSRDCRDPLGYVDGGEKPGAVYQKCCTARAFQGSSLVARLLPGGLGVWNDASFHEYVDRWVDFGAWTLPDPQNRFPDLHGSNADTGGYGSKFMRAMWAAHREPVD